MPPGGGKGRWPDRRRTPWTTGSPRAGRRHANPVAAMERADLYGKCRSCWKPAPTMPGFPQRLGSLRLPQLPTAPAAG